MTGKVGGGEVGGNLGGGGIIWFSGGTKVGSVVANRV